jgi:carboxymethylenebutenolidase
MPERWDTIEVNGGKMRCYVALPGGEPPWEAVVVIQHAGGVDDFVRDMSDRIALAGFAAIAPDLYHRDDPESSDDALTRMGRLRDRNIIADVNATIDHLGSMPEIKADSIGITGFCMGGRVAYLMACQHSALKAAVVFYGGNIMVPWGEGQAPFEQSKNINCPILGLFGADDGNPNPDDVAKLDGELIRLGKEHEFHSYAGAGHAFMSEGRPSYREAAAEDAWAKCIAWFQHYLVA